MVYLSYFHYFFQNLAYWTDTIDVTRFIFVKFNALILDYLNLKFKKKIIFFSAKILKNSKLDQYFSKIGKIKFINLKNNYF